jgi:hypothetical protein
MNLWKLITGIFTGAVGGAAATGVQAVAYGAMGVWFLQNKDVVAVSLTYGHLAFVAFTWAPVLVVLHIVHTRRESQEK